MVQLQALPTAMTLLSVRMMALGVAVHSRHGCTWQTLTDLASNNFQAASMLSVACLQNGWDGFKYNVLLSKEK